MKDHLDEETRAFRAIRKYQDYYRSLDKDLKKIDQKTIDRINSLGTEAIRMRDRIVEKYQDFVDRLATKIVFRGDQRFPDIVSVGMMALAKSVETYNLDRDIKFTTYAYPYIKGAMIREKYRLHHTITYPEDWLVLNSRFENYHIADRVYVNDHERERQFMKAYGISEKKMKNIKSMLSHRIPREEETFQDQSIRSKAQDDMDPGINELQDKRAEALQRAIESLSERKRRIISIIVSSDDRTKAEIKRDIATELKVTPQRVSQLLTEIKKEISLHLENDVEWNSYIRALNVFEKAGGGTE